jgi:hypothetical protein
MPRKQSRTTTWRSCKDEPAFWGRDWPSQLSCGFKPLLYRDLGIDQGLLVRLPIRGATGKLRYLSDECLVLLAGGADVPSLGMSAPC